MATAERQPAHQYTNDAFVGGVYKILGCWAAECRVRVDRGLDQTYRVVHDDLRGEATSERAVDIDISRCLTLDEKAEVCVRAVRAGFSDVHPDQHEAQGQGD
jgi:hypothetical protein